MASVREAIQAVAARKQDITGAKENISKAKASIPITTTAQLRGQRAPSGLAGRKIQRQLRGARGKVSTAEKEVAGFEKEVLEYEGKVEDYLKTDAGKIQYAQEYNLPREEIRGRVSKGGSIELLGYEYSTPYGTVIDYSPRDRLIAMQEKLDLIERAEERYVSGVLGLTSPHKIKEAGIDVRKFLRGEQIEIQTDVGAISAGTTFQIEKGPNQWMLKTGDSQIKADVSSSLPTSKDYTLGLDQANGALNNRQNYKNMFTDRKSVV